ncbi:MAG: ABC transporter ATP-binding protein [Pseudomonadota bacterium]
MIDNKLISLQNIGCSYKVRKGRFRFRSYDALKDISLDIFKGETVGIIGRNGAGKSTLLHILARIITPNCGKIFFHQDISISLLSLQLGFTPELSGRDNAIMGAMLLGYTKKEALNRFPRIVAFSELGDWINEPVKTYSSGMKARLGFAIAMEMSPDILLVDEVLGVGDEAFRKKSIAAMKEKMLSGQTVIFVSHQPQTIRELCTRLAWLEKGAVKMVGGTEEVLGAYHKQF